ncbi:MAG: peptidylprolyl isomerase [Pseudomonadota bacterium]
MRKSKIAALTFIAASCCGITAHAAPEVVSGPAVVAKVNGVIIPQEDLDVLLRDRLAQGETDTPELRKQLRNELVIHELVSQEATKKGLDKRADTLAEMKLARHNILFNTYLRDFLAANPVVDADAQKEYDEVRTKQGARELRVRHILVESEAVAKYLISQLNKKEDFGKLAGAVSADEATRGKGGEIDWMPEGNFPASLMAALATLKKGQYTTEPVKSEYGWHILKLEDERPINYPPFEEVKEKIKEDIQQRLFDVKLGTLQAAAKIE